jgi:hypothetical protein
MNYKKHYELLIERAKTRVLTSYFERHHIIPKCVGGANTKENIVKLTPEEHYVAHQLLIKIYPGVDALVFAAKKMTVSSGTQKRNNKLYGWLKRKHQLVCRKRVGHSNPSFGKKWYYNIYTLESKKLNLTDLTPDWVEGRILNKENFLTTQRKIKLKEDKKLNKELEARKLFDTFRQGKFNSLLDFVNKGDYNKSHEALRVLWKEYIPEYRDCSSQGTPFKSSGGSSEAERLASNQ